MSNTLEDLINSDPEWKRRYELIRKLGAESERGMAVLVGAELDRALEPHRTVPLSFTSRKFIRVWRVGHGALPIFEAGAQHSQSPMDAKRTGRR
jgi:hypothetical protein